MKSVSLPKFSPVDATGEQGVLAFVKSKSKPTREQVAWVLLIEKPGCSQVAMHRGSTPFDGPYLVYREFEPTFDTRPYGHDNWLERMETQHSPHNFARDLLIAHGASWVPSFGRHIRVVDDAREGATGNTIVIYGAYTVNAAIEPHCY